jgi:protein O-mannosyl-transferase
MSRAQRFLPLGLGLLAWLPALWLAGWALDDRELIFGNPVIDGSAPWWTAFQRAYFDHLGAAGQWRPLAALSLRASHAIWNESVAGYHFGNLALHLAVIALAGAVLRRRFEGRAWLFGLCVFAVHPALADVVAWISGRTSSLGALCGLAGALGVVRARLPLGVGIGAFVSVGGALLAKEDGLLFAPLCALLVLGQGRARFASACSGAALAVLAIGSARWLALGAFLPSAGSPALGSADLATRLTIGGHEWIEALRLGVFPIDYPPQYRAAFLLARTDPLPDAFVATLGWTLAGVVPLVAWMFRRQLGRAAALSALLAVLALLPVVQLVPLGEIFAPRFLYLPLLFAAPFVGAVHASLPRLARRLAWLSVPLVLVPLAWQRTTVYAGRGAWRTEMLEHMPNDAASWNDLGLAHEENGELSAARAAFTKATRLDPAYSRGWTNLGRLALAEGDEALALAHFERAAAMGPRNPVAHANLGMLRLRRGDPRGSAVAYGRATELAPGMVAAWRGLARAKHATGETDAALRALDRALRLSPTDELALDLRRRWTAAED